MKKEKILDVLIKNSDCPDGIHRTLNKYQQNKLADDFLTLIKQDEKDTFKEFIEYIKQSWQEEIKLWQELLEAYPVFSHKRKIIEQKLISMRKMLGSLDSDLEDFLEVK